MEVGKHTRTGSSVTWNKRGRQIKEEMGRQDHQIYRGVTEQRVGIQSNYV